MLVDLLVLGAGPAGLAVATSAAAHGMRVACVDPAPRAPWQRSFGMWSCEAAELGDLAPIEASWARPVVDLGGASPAASEREEEGRFVLDAPYCRIDVAELQRRLHASAVAGDVELVTGRAVAVSALGRKIRVDLEGGGAIRAEVVVDASGAASPWIQRGARRAPAFQVAFGRLVEVDSHPFAPGEMALMDYRPIPGEASLPTFLYALPLGPHRIFVEETSLAGRPAVPLAVLERRLDSRLRHLGIIARRHTVEERCVIPLGIARSRRDQDVLAFGAAAGMVHPATGYQLARALRLAPRVAARLAASGGPRSRIRAAFDVVWPPGQQRAWELYTFGMETLLRLDHAGIRRFFRAFFAQDRATWLPYLRGTASPVGVARAMWGVLGGLDASARWDLVRVGRGETRALFRALAGAAS